MPGSPLAPVACGDSAVLVSRLRRWTHFELVLSVVHSCLRSCCASTVAMLASMSRAAGPRPVSGLSGSRDASRLKRIGYVAPAQGCAGLFAAPLRPSARCLRRAPLPSPPAASQPDTEEARSPNDAPQVRAISMLRGALAPLCCMLACGAAADALHGRQAPWLCAVDHARNIRPRTPRPTHATRARGATCAAPHRSTCRRRRCRWATQSGVGLPTKRQPPGLTAPPHPPPDPRPLIRSGRRRSRAAAPTSSRNSKSPSA